MPKSMQEIKKKNLYWS